MVDLNLQHGESDKVTYLNMIQGVITRMAGNSAIMKGFASTIIVAVFGMMVTEIVKWYYLLIALIPMISFVYLDIFYLKLEKKYRNLYALIAQPKIYIEHYYSLDLRYDAFKKYKNEINNGTKTYQLIFSHSIAGFYGWFILAGLMCVLIA